MEVTAGGQTSQGSLYVTLDLFSDKHCPLYERGWVLQEEILSTRALVFGGRHMSWRCLCGDASEMCPGYYAVDTLQDMGRVQYGVYRYYPSGSDGFNELRLWLQESDPMPDRVPWQRNNHFDQWYKAVTAYSLRTLMFSSDTLPALSGLASSMAQRHICTYFAGLWKEDLQIGLAWYVGYHDTDRQRQGTNRAGHQNPSYIAPTWSWASHSAKYIRFRSWENNTTHMVHEGIKFVAGGYNQPRGSLKPFGAITKGSLTLSDQLRRAIIRLHDRPWRELD